MDLVINALVPEENMRCNRGTFCFCSDDMYYQFKETMNENG